MANSKSFVVGTLSLVLVAAGVAYVSPMVEEAQRKLPGMEVAQKLATKRAGFDRLLAHIDWMRLIQFRASLPPGKPTEPVQNALFRRYDSITDMDPFLDMAYRHGVLELATSGAPAQALKLVDKGLQAHNNQDWELAFHGAFVASQYLKDPVRAEQLLKIAMDVPSHSFQVESAWVHCKLQQDKKSDPLSKAKLWKSLVKVARPMSPEEGGMDMGMGMVDTEFAAKVRSKIVMTLSDARSRASDLTGADRTAMLAQASEIERLLRSMGLNDPQGEDRLRARLLQALSNITPGSPDVTRLMDASIKSGPSERAVIASGLRLRSSSVSPEKAREAMACLISSLHSGNANVRREALTEIKALGAAGSEAAAAVSELLCDQDLTLATLAAETLGAMGPAAQGSVAAIKQLVEQPR